MLQNFAKVRRYPRVRCLKYCCVAACLQAVIEVHGYREQSQLNIALELGLTVPTAQAQEYPGARVDDRPEMWGEHIHEPGTAIDEWLARHIKPLRYDFYAHNVIPFGEHWIWLDNQIRTGADVLALYDYGVLQDGEPREWGHAALILATIDETYETILLSDPGNYWAEREIKVRDLLDAMRTVCGGFGIIRVVKPRSKD